MDMDTAARGSLLFGCTCSIARKQKERDFDLEVSGLECTATELKQLNDWARASSAKIPLNLIFCQCWAGTSLLLSDEISLQCVCALSVHLSLLQGCIELLERYNVPIAGKNAVVVGRSNIVGLPAALLLQNRDATVTIVHSRTKDAQKVCAGELNSVCSLGGCWGILCR